MSYAGHKKSESERLPEEDQISRSLGVLRRHELLLQLLANITFDFTLLRGSFNLAVTNEGLCVDVTDNISSGHHMRVVDVLEKDLDTSSFLNLLSVHLLRDLHRGFLDSNDERVSKGALSISLVICRENNCFLPGKPA